MRRLPDFVEAKDVFQVRVAVTPDGKRAVEVDNNGDLVVWDLVQAKVLVAFNWGMGAPNGAIPVAFSADHESLMIASSDGTARIYPVTVEGFLAAARKMLKTGKP